MPQPIDHDASLQELESIDFLLDEKRALLTEERKRLSRLYAPKWEYQLLDDLDVDALNEWGRYGWEVVSTTSYTVGWGIGGSEKMKVHLRYTLKRPISHETSEAAEQYLEEIIALKGRRESITRNLDGFK